MSELPRMNCNFCKKPSDFVCQRCCMTYCSAECQEADWREHNTKCKCDASLIPFEEYWKEVVMTSSATPSAPTSSAIDDEDDLLIQQGGEGEFDFVDDANDVNVAVSATTPASAPAASLMCTETADWDRDILNVDGVDDADLQLLRLKPVRSNTSICTLWSGYDVWVPLPSSADSKTECNRTGTGTLDFLRAADAAECELSPLVADADADADTTMANSSTEFIEIDLTAPSTMSLSDTEKSKSSSTNLTLSDTWTQFLEPPKGIFFDAIVQHFQDGQKQMVWLIEQKNAMALQKLTGEINRDVDALAPCTDDELYVGALVAALYAQVFYRAEVLQVQRKSQMAKVRFIDYGNNSRLPFNKIRAPLPIMANLEAFAFLARIPPQSKPLRAEAVISVRISDMMCTGVPYPVEFKPKTVPLHLPLKLLNHNPEVVLHKIFADNRHALVQLKAYEDAPNMEAELAYGDAANSCYELDSIPIEGGFVAAETEQGWRRACLFGFSEVNNCFLVYLIDEGSVRFVQRLKKIPDAFILYPMRIIAMASGSSQKSLPRAAIMTAKKLSLHLLFPLLQVEKETLTLACTLRVNDRKAADVLALCSMALFYDGRIKLWTDVIPEDSAVFIVRIVSQTKLCISAICAKDYPEMFASMAATCVTYADGECLMAGDLVLVTNAASKQCFRGVITVSDSNEAAVANNSDADTQYYMVLDIDKMVQHQVARTQLRKPNIFVRFCPAYMQQVKLAGLEEPNAAVLAALECCQRDGEEFNWLQLGDAEDNAVELFYRKNASEQVCLNKQLQALLPEPPAASLSTTLLPSPPLTPPQLVDVVLNGCDANTQTDVSALLDHQQHTRPATPADISDYLLSALTITDNGAHEVTPPDAYAVYTMADIETVRIPTGEDICVFVVDMSGIFDGYLTAAYFEDKEALQQHNIFRDMIAMHCRQQRPTEHFTLIVDQLCLVNSCANNKWCRAVCLAISGKTYLVRFIDFGNVAHVSAHQILPITKELLFPARAHGCYLEDMAQTEYTVLMAMIVKDPFIKCAVIEQLDGTYVLKVHGMRHGNS